MTTFVAPLRVSAQTDVATIIQNSVEANQRDGEADPQFAYTEQDLDPKGTRKTYAVTNVLGTPYERLIAINGKPLSASQEAEQRRKYNELLSERKSESREQRAQRIAKYDAERRRDHALVGELTKAFPNRVEGLWNALSQPRVRQAGVQWTKTEAAE